MVKARASEIEANLKKLDAAYRAVLVYGPNEGLVRERADRLSKQIVDDLSDTFNVARPSPEQVKSNRTILRDEVAAISMTGGRRLVRLDGAVDAVVPAVESVLEDGAGDGLLIVTAGNLGPRSGLRKLAEKSPAALAVPCYEDSAEDTDRLLRATLGDAGLSAEPDAILYLKANLGSDRMICRNELAKVILFKEGAREPSVSLADVQAVVGDSADWELGDLAAAVAGGEIARLDRLLERAEARRESPVGILRALMRRLERLSRVRALMDEGSSFERAASKLRPPLFFKDKPAFRSQSGAWSGEDLARSLALVAEAEAQCKSTGTPEFALAARACYQIATAASRERKR